MRKTAHSNTYILLALIVTLSPASLAAYSLKFFKGLTLPGTTELLVVDKAESQALYDMYKNRVSIGFMHAIADHDVWWGVNGLLIEAKQPNKNEPPVAYTVAFSEVIAVYNPKQNIKYINGQPCTFKMERHGTSDMVNRLAPETGASVYRRIAQQYRTPELQRLLAGATTCNRLLVTLCKHLAIKVPEETVARLLELNHASAEKLQIIMKLAEKEGKLSKTAKRHTGSQEPAAFRARLDELNLPEEAANTIEEAIDRLEKASGASPEAPSLMAYISFALDLPWEESMQLGKETFDLDAVEKELDEQQYGMEEVKSRIIDYLAFRSVSPTPLPLVLCLVGKPGVGKTSVCKGIAEALQRPFARIALGGVNTENDISGTSRVFLGAAAGKIMNAVRTTRTASPVIVLDELDKMATGGTHGNPADALLQVLDPEQNKYFYDNYLNFPFDLSKVIWIATANNESKIPAALHDRMQIIQVPSYSNDEKVIIAQTKILPRLIEKAGFINNKPVFSDEVLLHIINNYTFESGVRNLTTRLITLISKYARGYLKNETVVFTPENLEQYLGSPHGSLGEFKRKAKAIEPHLTQEAKDKIFSAIEQFDGIDEKHPSYDYLKEYIPFFLSLPWENSSEKDTAINLSEVHDELEKRHFGLDTVKEKILDFLSFQTLSSEKNGMVMLLAGHPGVGKTSIAKSVAKALGRGFGRISLGGVTNEQTLRGTSKLYSRPSPSDVLKALQQAGSKNAVILLDEVDKIQHPNIANMLLDILDPEQNTSFQDNYLDVPFDLSGVLFIATANDMSNIPYPLLSRLNTITLDSYSLPQKITIALNHIVPQLMQEAGFVEIPPFITREFIAQVILSYTREAGVRQLGQRLRTIFARYKRRPESFTGTRTELNHLFGFDLAGEESKAPSTPTIGLVNGLGYSAAGGSLLPIQVALVPSLSNGSQFIVTGLIKEVMQESWKAASAYIRRHSEEWNIDLSLLTNKDVHLHVPSGGIPKDGPSAGVAFCVGLVSVLTGRPVDPTCAMTGEIDLMGNVLPIGGLDQKLEAARQNNVTKVFVPEANRLSVELLSAQPEGVDVVYVSHINEVLSEALLPADDDSSLVN